MDDWLTIVLACGLAARLTRLITLDTITEPVRQRLSGLAGALIECPWCSGFWVAVGVGLSWWAWADQTWWQVTALIATIAWASGALAGVGMPSQHEIAVMGAVPLINADEPSVETVKERTETTIHVETGEIDPDELADMVAKAVRDARAGGSD